MRYPGKLSLNKWMALMMLFLVTVMMSSCGGAKHSQQPTAMPNRSLPPLPVSKIFIPVKIYMKPLLAGMDSSTSKEFTSENWPAFFQSSCDFRYLYRFVRSPFQFRCTNNSVDISFRGLYQIAGSKTLCAFNKQIAPWVTGSCGFGDESMRRVDININSTLRFLPNHQVQTVTQVNRIVPLDKCQVTLMQSDITQQIMDSIKASIEVYSKSFDQFIFELNNQPLITDWRKGPKVMPVAGYGFMNLNPTQLNIGPMNYRGDTLSFSLGYSGRPVFSSDSNRIAVKQALPPITSTPVNGMIDTYLDVVYDYEDFNKILNDSLGNKPFTVEGKTFVIKEVGLKGNDDGKINLDLSFTGYKTGKLSLEGTPVLDSANQVLSMPDIDFSIDSRDMLVNIGKGLFRKKIMKQLRNQSVLDLRELINRNRDRIAARLNQQVTEWMSTRGTLHELRLVGIMSTADHLQLQLSLKADLELVGNPPSSLVSY